MHTYNKDIGNSGESSAVEYLCSLGYVIIDKNFRCKLGEIDIIARDGNYIVFVEVKTRYSAIYGSPCEAVNHTKMAKLHKTAEYYILKNKLFKSYFRFDVVEIIVSYRDNSQTVRLIKNAFQL